MKTGLIITSTVSVVLAVIIGLAYLYEPVQTQTPQKTAGGLEGALSFSVASSSSREVPSFNNNEASTTAWYRLMATTSRQWCLFTNFGPGTVHLALDGDRSPKYPEGIIITASSTFEIDSNNLYTGSITAKAGATSTLAWTCL